MAKGFLFFDDWEKPFRKLSGDEFKALFWAMFDFQKNGTEPPEFNGASSLIADFVFPQLDRRLQKQQEGRENAEKRWNKEDTQSTKSDLLDTHKQPNDHLMHKDKTKDKTKDENIDSPLKPPVGADVYGERFDVFWNAYPRKNGKGAAEKAFKKIKPSGELLQKMLDAIVVQKQSDQWRRDNGQYIPNPATWLNQTRWEDEGTAQPNNQDITLAEFFS